LEGDITNALMLLMRYAACTDDEFDELLRLADFIRR
jgi:hypothetical protein